MCYKGWPSDTYNRSENSEKLFFIPKNSNFHENCPEFKKYLVLKILIRILTMVLAITGLPNLSIYIYPLLFSIKCTENSGRLVTWDVSILSFSLFFMFSLYLVYIFLIFPTFSEYIC